MGNHKGGIVEAMPLEAQQERLSNYDQCRREETKVLRRVINIQLFPYFPITLVRPRRHVLSRAVGFRSTPAPALLSGCRWDCVGGLPLIKWTSLLNAI